MCALKTLLQQTKKGVTHCGIKDPKNLLRTRNKHNKLTFALVKDL